MDQNYSDDDLVYVDPDARAVVGRVEWTKSGNVKPLEWPDDAGADGDDGEEGKGRRKRRRKRYYPWGTYRSMKRQHAIKGKDREIENYRNLEEALKLAMEEPFWD